MEKRELLFVALTASIVLFVVWATNAMDVREFGPFAVLLLISGVGASYIVLERWVSFEGKKACVHFSLTLLLGLLLSSMWLGAGQFMFRSMALLFVIFALIPPVSLYVREHLVKK